MWPSIVVVQRCILLPLSGAVSVHVSAMEDSWLHCSTDRANVGGPLSGRVCDGSEQSIWGRGATLFQDPEAISASVAFPTEVMPRGD